MPRGGKRENSGRKSAWHHSPSTVIRVPEVLATQILEVAHHLDQGGIIEIVTEPEKPIIETVTKPKSPAPVEGDGWLTTREAWSQLGEPKAWNTFRKMKPQALLNEYGVEIDLQRKVKGRTDSRWMRFKE